MKLTLISRKNKLRQKVKAKLSKQKLKHNSKAIELFSYLLEEEVEKTMDEKVMQGFVDIIAKKIESRDKNNYQNPITFKAVTIHTQVT